MSHGSRSTFPPRPASSTSSAPASTPSNPTAACRRLRAARNPFRGGRVRGCDGWRGAFRNHLEVAMYDFAIVALLALATLKLVDYLTDAIPQLRKVRSLATFVLGVGVTVLMNYSVFRGWGIDIRNETVGVWVTGFAVAGMTVPWRALFAYLTHDRAEGDETLGEHTPNVRAA